MRIFAALLCMLVGLLLTACSVPEPSRTPPDLQLAMADAKKCNNGLGFDVCRRACEATWQTGYKSCQVNPPPDCMKFHDERLKTCVDDCQRRYC
jgi:hypothetical protein